MQDIEVIFKGLLKSTDDEGKMLLSTNPDWIEKKEALIIFGKVFQQKRKKTQVHTTINLLNMSLKN